MAPIIQVSRLTKSFRQGQRALHEVDLSIRRGEMVALIGASGSGKSTLLRHIAGLIAADRGTDSSVKVNGSTVQARGLLDRDVRAARARIGFVFQQFNLVERMSVMNNVLAGALHRTSLWRSLTRTFSADDRARAFEALRRVGIGECAYQRASTLSGGQQQRAAISRALVQQAEVILADEPIASLDPASAQRVMDLLATINRESSVTVVVSLHQVDYALRYCPRTVALRAGHVVFDGPSTALTPEKLRALYGAQTRELFDGYELDQPVAHVPAMPQAA